MEEEGARENKKIFGASHPASHRIRYTEVRKEKIPEAKGN